MHHYHLGKRQRKAALLFQMSISCGVRFGFCDIVTYKNKFIMTSHLPSARTYLSYAFTFCLLIVLSSCAKRIRFESSTIVPGAEGRVTVKKDKNNNHAIDLEIKNLAAPDKLMVAKKVYVVWAETSEGGMNNLGQLKTSSGLLSSTYKASMNAITPYKPSRVFITAEDESTLQSPGSFVVLDTRRF
jgi:hypothetical protein